VAGTATDGGDYVGDSGVLDFDPGTTIGAIPVAVLGDLLDEIDETLTLEIGSPQGATIGEAAAIGTILDDDVPAVAVDDVAVTEGDAGSQDALIILSLSTPGLEAVELDVTTADGTATAGADYTAFEGPVSFAPGEVTATVAVPVLGDLLLEPDQDFTLELGTPTYGTLADDTATVTILDDELCPGPELLDNPGAESPLVGGELPGWVEVVGYRWRPRWLVPAPFEGEASFFAGAVPLAELVQDVDVASYATAIDGGAQRFRFSGRVRVAAEPIPDAARLVVEYRDDLGELLDQFDSGPVSEPEVWVEVADERPAPVGTRTIRVRLLGERFTEPDLDAAFDAISLISLRAAAITVGGLEVTEPEPGAVIWAEFPIQFACALDRVTALDFATRDGDAGAGTDYQAASGTLEVPAAATSAEVAVEILGDKLLESPERFFLDLVAGADDVLVGAEGAARIHDAGCVVEPLGAANRFNLFLFADLLLEAGDVGGRLAAGGNVDLADVSVGANLPGRDGPALVAGDGLFFVGGRVRYGDVIYGNWAEILGVEIPDGLALPGAPIDFAAERAALVALSQSLADRPANGTTTVTPRGGLRLVGLDPTLNVFELDAAELLTATSLVIRAPAGSTVLVDVTGARVVAASLPMALENVGSESVLFNFAEAGDVVVEQLTFRGSVLAPSAALGFVEAVVEGTVIGDSLKLDGQLDSAPFAGCLPPAEPAPNCIEEGGCE
jgi:choice-of-anchor A domain-containing protein